MSKHEKNILIAIGVILAYLVYGLFASIPLMLFNINPDKMNITFKIIYLLSYESLFVFMLIMIYKNDMKNDFKDFKTNFKTYLKEYIKYWFIMLLLMYASNFIILVIKNLFNQGTGIAKNEEYVREILSKYPIYTIISAVFLGPIQEEIVFRKTFRKIFNNKYIYIIISGLIFGLMHVVTSYTNIFDFLYIISYSIPGFIFAYIYYKSDNIFVSTSIHFIHNSILILLQLLLTLI